MISASPKTSRNKNESSQLYNTALETSLNFNRILNFVAGRLSHITGPEAQNLLLRISFGGWYMVLKRMR